MASKACSVAALVVTLAAVVTVANLNAQEKSDRLEASDIFNIQMASDPQISPDGKYVVYVRHFSDIQDDKRCTNLWIVGFDGADSRAITSGNFTDTSPRWSPDGTRIAYVSDRDGMGQLYVRWMDTGQTAKLTNLENSPGASAWSPDGKQIAFTSFVPTAGPKMATLPTPPPGAKWADPPKVYDRLIYRFNGLGYLKPGFTQIFVISSDGGAPRQLTTGNFPHAGSAFGGGEIKWTPDGKFLLTSGSYREDYEYHILNTEVYQISLDDGSTRSLTTRKGPNNSPDISPDGSQIAYTGFDDKFLGHQTSHLSVMNRDGSDSRVITPKLDRDAEEPHWSADGKGVYFIYDDQGDTKIGYATLDGTVKTVAQHLGSSGSSYSAGGSFTMARNGNFAFTHDTTADPGDIAVATESDTQPRLITSLNAELFQQKKPGQVEEIWFNSSVDQRKIQGWIVKPPDFDSSKKYPLILEIHGGPFANYGDRFDTDKQIWAAKDYVVLYLNPRGSTSYGEDFANLIHHNYPSDDFYDLNSGVDAVIAKGYIDTDNLFVTGGSGGGVLTCWMIDRTTRFRAAASLYPVINWYSWSLTTDIPILSTQYWFPGLPWDNMEQYMKRSVLSYINKVKTPTLLMTGEEDFRTPLSEAEQFYTGLKLQKIEAVLVRVPGEPHGISRRPSHEIAKTLYTLGWFEQHRAKH